MGLIDRVARTMHSQQGWWVSDSFTDSPTGSWGTVDGYLFERLGHLKDVGHGVPAPLTHTIEKGPTWYRDSGVTVGKWKVGATVGPIAEVSVDVEFTSKYGIACFLSSSTETQLDNTSDIGDALCALVDAKVGLKDKKWKTARKWVYTSLAVKTGFIAMSQESNVKVTLSGKGKVNASGVPVDIDVAGFIDSSTGAAQMEDLSGRSPFIKLCGVYDPLGPLTTAVWRQIG